MLGAGYISYLKNPPFPQELQSVTTLLPSVSLVILKYSCESFGYILLALHQFLILKLLVVEKEIFNLNASQ